VAELAQAQRGRLPILLLGDLNTAESVPALREVLDQGFVDLFRHANPTAMGATVRQDIVASIPTVRRRIDYVLLLPGTDVSATVVASRTVLNTPGRRDDGGALWPSDHYGVFAEIRLEATVPR
jgi:endonuclease/exonuclease/phosphatase family metal-dependent hydrolase